MARSRQDEWRDSEYRRPRRAARCAGAPDGSAGSGGLVGLEPASVFAQEVILRYTSPVAAYSKQDLT